MKKVPGLALVLVLVLLGVAAPAQAHVSVDPDEVPEGGFAVLTFRVPNESDTESTVGVEVVFPEAAPFRSVSVKPVPGWTHTVARDGDTVVGISWDGGEIGPGEFQEFDVAVGPVPEVDVLEFKALQTYSGGEVVRWIDATVEGEDAPDHPAPRAVVVPSGGGDDPVSGGGADGDTHDGDVDVDRGEETTAADPDDDGVDGTEPATFVALLVAGIALVAAVAAIAMTRQRVPR